MRRPTPKDAEPRTGELRPGSDEWLRRWQAQCQAGMDTLPGDFDPVCRQRPLLPETRRIGRDLLGPAEERDR